MKSGSDQDGDVKPANRWQDAEELRWAVRHWAARIGVKAPQIHLREMRHKWASISECWSPDAEHGTD